MIPEARAEQLREKFTAAFVDTECEYYARYRDRDGCRFLWDCPKNLPGKRGCTQEEAAAFLKRFESVYFMWDHWRDRTVFADEYPNAVIAASGGEVGRLAVDEWNAEIEAEKHDCYIERPQLPSDIYVFDDSFSWYVVFTHEFNDCENLSDIVRYCLILQPVDKEV